jgi:Cofactor assembly of complex C subunit B
MIMRTTNKQQKQQQQQQKRCLLPFLLLIFFVTVGSSNAFVTPSPSTLLASQRKHNGNPASLAVTHLSPVDLFDTTTVSSLLADATAAATTSTSSSPDYIPGTSGEVSYSRASYYVILGLYLTSFPGLWSVIKRSTSAKVKRKTYVSKGGNVPDGKSLREQAGEIMAYMKANNYEVVNAGETITFRGIVQRSTSQAFFLVFCAAVGLASLALVLQIQFQNLGKCDNMNLKKQTKW